MNIHQLSLQYVAEQDRILLRLNSADGEELRLWLTRRLLLAVSGSLQRACLQIEAGSSQSVALSTADQRLLLQHRRDESLKTANFSTPFKDTPARLPLGAEPLLVTDLDIAVTAQQQLRLGFAEKLASGAPARSFQVLLEAQLLHGFMHLLDSAQSAANWGQQQQPAGASLLAGLIEALQAQERPKYLH